MSNRFGISLDILWCSWIYKEYEGTKMPECPGPMNPLPPDNINYMWYSSSVSLNANNDQVIEPMDEVKRSYMLYFSASVSPSYAM